MLVDAGDFAQGTAFGNIDNGASMVDLMNQAGYDIATLGNHEFDWGIDNLASLIDDAEFPIVTSNFYHTVNGQNTDLVLDPYVLRNFGGTTVAFVGTTTPESITKSTPAFFQDDNGNYIYGFAGGSDGQPLYNATQEAVDAARAAGADHVVLLAHLGIDGSSAPWRSTDVIANTTGIDAVIDGHSHSVVPMQQVANANGENVLLTQSGQYFDNIGVVTLNLETGDFASELINDYTGSDSTIRANIDALIAQVDAELGQPIAETELDFYVMDPTTGLRNIRTRGTNMGDMNTDAYYYILNNATNGQVDLTIANGGGTRADIAAGEWTYLDAQTVNPFGNVLAAIEVTGQQILDALEFGARGTLGDPSIDGNEEIGGFLHVSGASYTVDTNIESTVQLAADGTWGGAPTGEYRIQELEIYNKDTGAYEPIDLAAKYVLGGTNYPLRGGGDGLTMFGDHTLVIDFVTEDYLALSEYAASFTDTDGNGLGNIATANSPLLAANGGIVSDAFLMNYEDPLGSGRISFVPYVEPVEDTTLTILYTNDVHTYIDKELSYDSLAALKAELEAQGKNVLLVSAGDFAQGTAYGNIDDGASMVELMNQAGYDIATLGNHEFDYGMENLMSLINAATFETVTSNFYHAVDGQSTDLVLKPYTLRTYGDKTVAFVGTTTPESITKSTPAFFQDANGNYIYGFAGGNDGQPLYNATQTAVDAARAEGADHVVLIAHLGVDNSAAPWRSIDVIANTTGIDAVIDGHSHTEMPMEILKNADGEDVLLTQSGQYFDNIGIVTVDLATGEFTSELISEYEGSDATIRAAIDALIAQVQEELGQPVAETEIDFVVMDPTTGLRNIRTRGTNMGDLNADAYYYTLNRATNNQVDLTIANGGGTRADIAAGEWTYLDAQTVNPFGNVLAAIEVTGQQILDAIEFGARGTLGDSSLEGNEEIGGFLHVSGARYSVDTSIESTVQIDDNGSWAGAPTGEYRVHSLEIFNKDTGQYEPIDLAATYTLGGTNYPLRGGGDGLTMFADHNLLVDFVTEDYLSLSEYIAAFNDTDGNGLGNIATANSPLLTANGGIVSDAFLFNYEDPYGAGRISFAAREVVNPTEPTTEVLATTPTETTTGEPVTATGEGVSGIVIAPLFLAAAVVIFLKRRQFSE